MTVCAVLQNTDAAALADDTSWLANVEDAADVPETPAVPVVPTMPVVPVLPTVSTDPPTA